MLTSASERARCSRLTRRRAPHAAHHLGQAERAGEEFELPRGHEPAILWIEVGDQHVRGRQILLRGSGLRGRSGQEHEHNRDHDLTR